MISISSQTTQLQSLTGQLDQKESALAEGRKSSVDVRFLVALKMAKMVFSIQETRLPSSRNQTHHRRNWNHRLGHRCGLYYSSDIDEERIEWVREAAAE